MKSVTIRFEDAVAQPAVAAARAKNMSLNEYVQRAVAEKLAADLHAVQQRADANIEKYAEIIEYLAEH